MCRTSKTVLCDFKYKLFILQIYFADFEKTFFNIRRNRVIYKYCNAYTKKILNSTLSQVKHDKNLKIENVRRLQLLQQR